MISNYVHPSISSSVFPSLSLYLLFIFPLSTSFKPRNAKTWWRWCPHMDGGREWRPSTRGDGGNFWWYSRGSPSTVMRERERERERIHAQYTYICSFSLSSLPPSPPLTHCWRIQMLCAFFLSHSANRTHPLRFPSPPSKPSLSWVRLYAIGETERENARVSCWGKEKERVWRKRVLQREEVRGRGCARVWAYAFVWRYPGRPWKWRRWRWNWKRVCGESFRCLEAFARRGGGQWGIYGGKERKDKN